MTAEWVRWRPERFLSGWVMVSAESGRLLENPDQLAVDLADVRDDGNGVYTITTRTDETFRLIKRVGPLDPGVNLTYGVDVRDDGVPTVEVTLSERLVDGEVAPMLARALAESTAALRATSNRPADTHLTVGPARGADGDRVFGPGGTPDVDVVQRPVDAGLRAELRQRGLQERRLSGQSTAGRSVFERSRRQVADRVRRAAVRKEIRQLALTMGVADGQPNAKLLRTLLAEDERAILDRAKSRAGPLEDRVDQPGYLAKSLGGSGVSSVLIGTAAAAFTGNPLVGIGIAVPTIVNAAVGSVAERHLDRQKATGRKPAYNADRAQREYDYPGLRGLLDGPVPTRPPAVKMPRATAWRNYLARYIKPTLATAAVAGALTPFGVPAMSTALVIASSALAKSLAERLVDKKKLEFRLRRIDATERLRLSDPTLYVNQLTTEFSNLRTRLTSVITALGTNQGAVVDSGGSPGVTPPAQSDVPGSPPYTVSLAAQLIENVSGAARRAFIGGRSAVDVDPTVLARHVSPQLESLVTAVGPGLLGAVTGAMGDKYFLNRDEAARDASKQWSRSHQEAAQAEALAGILEPRLHAFRELADRLEELTGVPPDARAADRGLPVVTERPAGPRPLARAPWSAYAVQAGAGALGGVAGAVGLDLVFDLPDLAVVLTSAGAAGAMTATPVARNLFRRRELQVHEGLEANKAVREVNQSELLEQRAITRYLTTQLTMLADTIVQHTAPRRVVEAPSETSPEYTDHVRAAVRRAELDNLPSAQPETAFDRDARVERVRMLERVDRWAAEVDRLEALGEPGEPLANAREKVRFAVERFESIVDSNGMRREFPNLGTVDPADGQRVTGGVTDQVRSGVRQAVRRLAAEPIGKPLLAERLITLEQLSRAANAIDNHALHGTPESQAHVQQHFDQTLADANRLWRESDVPNGLVLPALAGDLEVGQARDRKNEDEKLRRMVASLLGSTGHTEGGPSARRTEGGASARRTAGGPSVRRADDTGRGR